MSTVMVVRVVPKPIVGTCGEVRDRQFEAFEADLDWLEVSGVPVDRVDPTTRPDALATVPDVERAWNAEGGGALPLIGIGGRIVSSGAFLSRSRLAHLVAEQRRLHSIDMVRHVAALGAAAALGTVDDLVLERQAARGLDLDESEIEVAIEAGRHVAHHDHAPAVGEESR